MWSRYAYNSATYIVCSLSASPYCMALSPKPSGIVLGQFNQLLFCALTRANYFLRMLPPHCTADYYSAHDRAVASCLGTCLWRGLTRAASPCARHCTAFGFGGLGLRSATSGARAAYTGFRGRMPFPALLPRFPAEAAQLQGSLNAPHAGMPSALAAACMAAARMREAGFPPPPGASELRLPRRIDVPVSDTRCIAANSLPLWHGARLPC